MGALDGRELSNTHFFAAAAGWRGLLIEPNPGARWAAHPPAGARAALHVYAAWIYTPACLPACLPAAFLPSPLPCALFSRHLWRRVAPAAPAAASFAQLIRNRRDSICVNAAVCSSYKRVHFVDQELAAYRATVVSGIYEFMSQVGGLHPIPPLRRLATAC